MKPAGAIGEDDPMKSECEKEAAQPVGVVAVLRWTPDGAPRRVACLRCEQPFKSQHKAERLCQACRLHNNLVGDR